MFNDISQEKIDCLKREIDKLKLSNITFRFNCGDGNEFIRELDIKELQKKCGTLLPVSYTHLSPEIQGSFFAV